MVRSQENHARILQSMILNDGSIVQALVYCFIFPCTDLNLSQLNVTTPLKWYCDQKSPYLFFLYFESMNYKYLPCQILSHDFDEKSDFLNYKFLI